jgi:5,10-methylenetetrahydromethanopterin reductase
VGSPVRRLLNGEALAGSDNAFGPSVAGSDATTEVPIVLAGTGPKMLTAGGKVADGVLTWMGDETYLAEVVFPAVARGAAEAGRAVPPVIAGVLICVSDDAERARAALRPRLASLGGYHSYQAVLSHGSPAQREPADVAVIGTEGEVATAFGRLKAVGVSELAAVVLPDPRHPPGSAGRARQLLATLASDAEPHTAMTSPKHSTGGSA